MTPYQKSIKQAAKNLKLNFNDKFDIAVISGSGLSNIFDLDQAEKVIDYCDVAGYSSSSGAGHHGKLAKFTINNRSIAFCLGRLHLYEGFSATEICNMVFILAELGVKQIIFTNAAGALNSNYAVGDLMIIEDHINLTGQNPIIEFDQNNQTRFTDMSQAYCPSLRARAFHIAKELNISAHMGIYAGLIGPTLETNAERRMLSSFGADAVGMSTVLEVIAANHQQMQVLGISAITNMALGDEFQKPDTLEQIMESATIASDSIKQVLEKLLSEELE